MQKELSTSRGRGWAVAILLNFILLTSMAQDPGFFLDEWAERTAVIPEHQFVEKPAGEPTVTIQVDASEVLGKVPQYIYGNNAVTWDDGLRKNSTAMTDLKNLDPHVLRWPGGNLSNSYFWNRNYGDRPGDIPDDISPWYGMACPDWQMSVDEYYWLLEQTNSTGSICVNYDYARYGTGPDPVAQAAHMAAEWVRYDNGRSRFWEIGNENFGNWEPGYQIDVSQNQDGQPEFINGQLYGQHCRVFIDSMRAAAAEIGVEIKIGVVAYDAETSYDPIQTLWNEGMMPEVGDLADFLVVHNYFTPYNQDSPVSTILESHPVAAEIMSTLVSDMTEAGKPMIPVAFTEWNIFAEGSMQQVSYINGMHAALLLGEFIKGRYGMSNRWDLVNGWNNGDDHAIFSSGGEPGVDPYNPRPAFFYMYYFQHFFGDRMVGNVITGSEEVVAYSSSFTSGETGMVIINKSTGGETVQVELENLDYGANYYYYTLTGGTDNGDFSRKVFLNGIGTDEEGGGPDEYASILAHASKTDGGVTVSLPPLSVVYLMVDRRPPPEYVSSKVQSSATLVEVKLSQEVQLTGDPTGFRVVINGTLPVGITTTEVDPVDATIIHLTLGQEVQVNDQVTLSYDGADVISPDGVPLISFSEMNVENLLPGSTPRITLAQTSDEGTEIQLTFSKEMEITAPAEIGFELTAGGEPEKAIEIDTLYIEISDLHTLVLKPAEVLFAEYALYLSYNGSGIGATDGTPLEPFDTLNINNQAPGMSPNLVSAEVANYGFEIRGFFDKPMTDLSASDTLFSIEVEGVDIPIEAILSGGDSMIISLQEYIRSGEQVTLSYLGTSVTSTDRGILQPISDYQVENLLPAPTVFDIPGTIDAEQFTINMGMELEPCTDDGGGYNLGYIDPGDWLEFEIDVADQGIYSGLLRVAAANATGLLWVYSPDSPDLEQDTLGTPITGGWQQWASAEVELQLQPGRQRLRMVAITGNYNLNWLSLEYSRPLQASFVSASTNETGDTVRIEFDKTMTTPAGKNPAGLTLTADGTVYQVASVSWSQDTPQILLLRLLTPLTADLEQITLSYDEGALVDADQQPVIPFSDQMVTNQVVTLLEPESVPSLRLYPNPVRDVLHIELPGSRVYRMTVQLLDITGKTMLLEEFSGLPGNTSLNLNMESMKEGLYLVRITLDGRMVHQTVVKR